MSVGRWDPQTRIAVVVAGMLVVTIGVLSTLQWRSGIGAAALVIGGLLVSLAGVAGGTIFGPRETPEIHLITGPQPTIESSRAANLTTTAVGAQPSRTGIGRDPAVWTLEAAETTPAQSTGAATGSDATGYPTTAGHDATWSSEAATAHEAGDTEGATAAISMYLRLAAPHALAYYETVRDTIAASVDGRAIFSLSGHLLGPMSISGLPVAIDIRAGVNFSLAAVRETYQSLFDGPAGIAAVLVVVNTDGTSTVQSLNHLRGLLTNMAVIVVPWRIGDPTNRIVEGLARACGDASRKPASSTAPKPREGGESRDSQPSTRMPPRHDDGLAWQHANDLHWRGKLQEAEEAYRAIVESRSRTLGWNHLDTLTARDQHATVLRDLDRLAEALVECDEVLQTRTMFLGPDHADTLTSRSHLATIYHQLGDLTRAQTEHRQVLSVRVRMLGKRDAETLISRSNLAKVYQDLGELDLAIEEHKIVMRERSETLGGEHHDTLMSRSLLASALHQANRLEEAESQHRAVLLGRMRELGPHHLDTAVSRHRLASVLHDLNRLDEAIAEYTAAREVYTELLGHASPFARAAASDLALAERALRTSEDSQRASA